jgi:dihydrofolate reductase
MILSIISAIGRNNEIGKKNALLWDLPRDMKHFRETTEGHTVIMGQKTFESLGQDSEGKPGRPLPNRRNIVITLDNNFLFEGVEVVHSPDELINLLKNTEKEDSECFVIGGGQIYRLFINEADRLYITYVDVEFPDADAYFPLIDMTMWEKTNSEKYPADEQNKYNLEFTVYNKK